MSHSVILGGRKIHPYRLRMSATPYVPLTDCVSQRHEPCLLCGACAVCRRPHPVDCENSPESVYRAERARAKAAGKRVLMPLSSMKTIQKPKTTPDGEMTDAQLAEAKKAFDADLEKRLGHFRKQPQSPPHPEQTN